MSYVETHRIGQIVISISKLFKSKDSQFWMLVVALGDYCWIIYSKELILMVLIIRQRCWSYASARQMS